MTKTRAIGEAPAKVIITGEHFVVHGAWALAAAVDLSVRAEVWKEDGLVVDADRGGAQHTPDVGPVCLMLDALYMARNEKPDVHVKLTSEIPSGSGLGSSAAAMVATAAAVAKLEGWAMNELAIIESAMVGERKIHGRPSGVDVTTSVLGGVILFKMGEAPKKLELPEQIQVLIIYSGTIRNTGMLISRVSSSRARSPLTFSAMCESVSMLSELASTNLLELKLEQLGKILTLNHAVLENVGASNAILGEIVELCMALGCYGAKLTGAGGGGSVIALPRPGTAEKVRGEIIGRGYTCFHVTIPAGGVRAWTKD